MYVYVVKRGGERKVGTLIQSSDSLNFENQFQKWKSLVRGPFWRFCRKKRIDCIGRAELGASSALARINSSVQ